MSKPDVKKLSHSLCFRCSSIFTVNGNVDKKCPYCGYCPNPDLYNKIMNYAMSSVYYGYDYRKKYDKQITEKGEITTVHALSDSATILNFLAVAALSGIIGGISYDAVKKIFRQILNLAKNCKENIGQDKIEFYVDNDIDIFIQMIKEFHFDFEGVSPAVKSEIIKEMIIWELTDSVFSIKKNGQISKEEIFEKLKQVIERVEHTKTLSKQDFIDFWDKVKEND